MARPRNAAQVGRRTAAGLICSVFAAKQEARAQITDRSALQAAARIAAAALAAELDQQWGRVRAVAVAIEAGGALQNVAALRRIMDAAQRGAPHMIWVGVANARDGKIVAASGGVIEGMDASHRPWFRAGLQRSFSGDVHSAVLLQRSRNHDPRDEPLRLIDFAMPIYGAEKRVVGVLGSHVEWRWVVQILRNAPTPAGAAIALVAQDGEIRFAPDIHGMADFRAYPTIVVPQGTHTPSLGWRVVGLPASLLRQ